MKRYPNCLYLAALLFVLITVELSGQTYTVSQAGSFSPMYSSPISVSLYSEVSEALPIGFNFDFFGNTYSDFYISTNGFITFNPNSNDGCCEGQFIPSPSDPDNLIAGAWSGWYEFFYYDYYDPYNSIYIEQEFSYETIGTAPNRTLHVNFVVSDDCIDYINYPFGYDFQIILYETSNKIEIHTNAVESFCNTMTQGIENSSGTEAHHVTGRNAGYWSASHDYVAFELVPPSDDDAGVVGFTGTVCSGMQDVIVYIKNYGANDIDSVDIEWEFDGVPQTPVTFDSYSLSPGLSTPVTLANESFTFPDTHTLKVWTSMPNGNVDPKNNNDTLDVTLQVAMQGVYTIGGTSPDYATFNSALTDLQAYGICDSVIFNVRDGNYFEQLSTGFIGGAFGDKRVIFQSESGDSSAVQLVFTGTNSSNNFVINLDGAWNITFRNLTLQNSGSSYARVFDIRNGSRNIEVQNCEIKGKYSVSTSTLLAAVYSQGPNNEIKFNNNHFFDGTYGIYHTSFGELPYGKDMVIQNNRFDNFYHRGIHLVEMTSPVIDGNRLANTGTNTNAIYLHTINGDGIQISNNELILTQADIGIRLAYIDSESADQPLVYNNRVSIVGTNDSRGIVIDNLTNVGIYHNSVHISGTDPDALAFELTSSANVDIRNNIFANSGTGIAFKTNTTSSGNHADYNDLFATGESIAAIGASEYGNLTSWQNATQWDSNGISIDPLFVSDTNLHVQQTFLNGIGTPIADVTEDFEGDTRDPASPDIGADEFYPPGNDIGVLSFFSPGLDCNNSQSIIVVVQNFGSSVVDSLTLQWSISGVSQSPIDLVRTIDTIGGFGTDTIHVLLSTENFITDSLYSLKAWTSMPNGTADGFLLNDTSDLNYQLPFNGTYSVGPSNADFPDLTSAVAALEQHGVCGPVRLELQDGTYTEQVTIHEIAGTSAANRVTITSESQDTALVKIQFDAVFGDDNWVIRLSGADYITFSHVCIEGIDVFRTRGIVAVNNPKHIVISDCRFLGTINDDDNSELIYGNDLEGDLDWLIENNSFEDGSHALYVEGRDILNSFSNVTFRNNEMVDQNRYFVAFRYGSGVTIESNNIYRNDVDIFFPTGIFLTDMEGQNLVSSNKIIYDTDGVGIWLNQVNRMDTSSRIKIFNNFISIFDGAYGLRANNSRRVQVYYNNIHNRELSDFSYAFHSSSSDTLDIRNNNFVSAQAAAYVIAYSTDSVRSDNNNFQSPGATLISTYMGGYADLNNWQVASGKDLNSMQVDPQFLSTSDLHVLADTLSGAGTPIAGITEDIDGEPRDPSAPTIGADETFINNLDVAIFALKPEMPFAKGTQDVKLVLYNFGSDDVTTLTADWEVNGSTQSTYNYSGSLLSGTFDTVTIGSHFFDYNLPYTIKAWTFGPNSLADENVANDTMLVSSLYPAVSGIVTIAGSTPDFDSIPQALEAMQNGGVLGGATLNIRTGTYSGNLLFENETFFSCETPVIIQSESGNPADVILDNASLTGIPLEINGADGLTFRNLTIRTLSNVYANAVKIQNQSNCNTFDGCVLEGRVTNSTSSSFAVVLSATDRDTANTLSNNEILNGSYGIYLNGPNQDEERNQITGNTFNEQYYRGVYMDHQIDPEVSNNNFATSTASTGYLAIYLYRSDQNINVSGNDISLPNQGGTGINISLSAQSTGNQGLISNNFVLVGSSSFSQGAQLYANQNLLFAHNTILVEGSNTSSRGLYIQNNTAGGASAVNNNIVNTSGGVAMLVSHVGQLSYSDHNNFLVTGPTLVTEQGTNYTDLAAWQANGYDANSLSVDPAFVSPIDLHVQSAFLNMTGTPVSAVPIDIDGEPRDLLMPDIGADEFNLVSDDIGLLSINYPVQPFPSGVQTVFIKFINNGDDTLITANVDWVINGDTMPTYMWSGLLPSGATYDSLDIGNYDFLPDSIHTIKVWVSDPNGVQDGLSANDTLQVGGLYPGLLGVYTVGGVEPDFEEIKDATSALNNGGAAGPVTFNIRDGIYLDSIHLFEFPGSDCNNPVVFQSESLDAAAVTITNLGVDGYPVHLDGADGITFRFLTLETVNPSFANTVRINGGADCNVFEQNEIVGYIINSSSVLYSTVYDLSGADYSNQYLSNHIQNGSYGLHLTHTGSPLSGTRIKNNTLSSAYYTSIYAGNHNGIEVESNEIIGSSYSSFRGIFLYNCDSTISVQRNSIDASNGRSPLILEACQSAVSSPGLVANNFITVGGSLAAKAIDLLNNTNLRIAHNNVHNFCSYGAGFGNTGIYISGGSAHDIRNNIFAGSGAFTTAIQTNNNPSFIHLDFNDLFSANGDIGYWNGTLAADLTAWQSLSSLDANSISQNPEYAGQTDLHVSNILLNGSADPIAGITLDYDGDVREVTPDIGADEFVPAASDDVGAFAFMGPVAPFAEGSQPVQIALKNFGGNNLTSAQVRWLVNGVEQTAFAWSGNLSPGQCDTVTVGTFTFAAYSPHDFIFWTEDPNGVPDSTNINDTLFHDNVYPGLIGTYTVGGVLPDFNLFTQLQSALNLGGILGDVTFEIRNGTYENQILINDFPRLSLSHGVTFKSESDNAEDVKIIRNFSGDNYTVFFNHARNVTLKELTLQSTSGRVVEIANGSSVISILDCILLGEENGYSSTIFATVYSGSTSEDSIRFLNNEIWNGAYGIFLTGSSGDREMQTEVTGNEIIGARVSALYLTFQEGLKISDNFIDMQSAYNRTAVYLTQCHQELLLEKNIVLVDNSGIGLDILSCTMPADGLGRVENNYFFVGGSLKSKGIYDHQNTRIGYSFNTIDVRNTHIESVPFEVLSYASAFLDILNNSLSNFGGGMAFYSYYTTPFDDFNYNNFHTTGPNIARVGGIYPSLFDLQANTGKNLNSVSVDPIFPIIGEPALLQVALDGAATPVSGVAEDYEGDIRNATTPDIGADEFVPVPNDIAVVALVAPATFCGLSASEDVTIRIQNRGSTAQTGFDVSYVMNGNQVTQNIGGLSVAAGQTVDFTFTEKVNLSTVGLYDFMIFSSLGTDSDLSSDTMSNLVVEHIPVLVTGVSNMLPADGEIDLDKSVSLS